MRAIIVDDELKSREVLKTLVENFCEGVEVIRMCEDIEDSIEAITSLEPDLLFLDIHLKNGDSFQILKALPSMHFDIIFCTAYDEYTVKALKFSGITCLFKPIDITELQDSIASIRDRHIDMQVAYEMANGLLKSKFRKIPVVTSSGLQFTSVEDVVYLEQLEEGVLIHLKNNESMKSVRTLDQFLDIILSKDFIRLDDQYIVNQQWIDLKRSGSSRLHFNNGEFVDVEKGRLYGVLKGLG